VDVECRTDPNNANRGVAPNLTVEMALKVQKSGAVLYFSARLPFHALFVESPPAVANPAAAWAAAADKTALVEASVPGGFDAAAVAAALREHRVEPLSPSFDYFSLSTSTGSNCLVRLASPTVQVRCAQRAVLPFVLEALLELVDAAPRPAPLPDLFGAGFAGTGCGGPGPAPAPAPAPAAAAGGSDLIGLF